VLAVGVWKQSPPQTDYLDGFTVTVGITFALERCATAMGIVVNDGSFPAAKGGLCEFNFRKNVTFFSQSFIKDGVRYP
jgi:hypothetical protein